MGRIFGIGTSAVLISFICVGACSAEEASLSAAGFTGFSLTPTARLLPWGSASFSYDSQVVGGPTTGPYAPYGTKGHNFVAGFGLFDFLEVSGRLAANTIQSNCYTEGCGTRDLSFNFKGGFALDSEGHWRVAAGGTDFGGQINYFRTLYGVAGYGDKNFDVSLGYSRAAKSLIGNSKPLSGAFGNAAYRPFDWLQTSLEYNNSKAWAGLKLIASDGWLPRGWTASVGVTAQVAGDRVGTSRNWINVGLTVPLYKMPTERASSARSFSSENTNSQQNGVDVTHVEARSIEFSTIGIPESVKSSGALNAEGGVGFSSIASNASAVTIVDDNVLRSLADELKAKGFEDISVGRSSTGAVAVEINNAVYNVNTVDGLGVALGVIARNLGKTQSSYLLMLNQRQVYIVGVTGQADCLAEWIAMKPPRCVAGELHLPGETSISKLAENITWSIRDLAPSWASARVILQPVINSRIATEYGVLDYSVGLRATIQQPLWAGAYAELSHVQAITNSDDFKANRVYGADRLLDSTDKVLLHQVFRFPLDKVFSLVANNSAARWGSAALTGHVAFGRINSEYRGAYGELRWEPGAGTSRFGLEAGRFERTTAYDYFVPKQSRPLLGSYRYSYMNTRTDFELTAGQFLHNDRGVQFLITQWFDDVAVNMYIRQTKFEYERASRTVAGVELVIPLTPRKDMNPVAHVQVTGTPRWSYGVETRVGAANFITTGQGIYPGVSILDRTFNSDRSSASYFENNMARIRSAASK